MNESTSLKMEYSKYTDEEKELPNKVSDDADCPYPTEQSHGRRLWLMAVLLFVSLATISLLYSMDWFPAYLSAPHATALSKIQNVSELKVSLHPHKHHRHVSRLIMVGDVHGHFKEFRKLTKKLKFNPKKDHIVLLGDFTTKGPDSIRMIDYMVEHADSVDCVLGNHEYYLLKEYAKFHGLAQPEFAYQPSPQEVAATEELVHQTNEDPKLIKSLKGRHVQVINRCSIMMRVGAVPGGLDGVAVHGGISPYLPLKKQNPYDVLEMRSLEGKRHTKPTPDKGGKSWSKVYNSMKGEAPADHVVYYGHDASRGLNLKKFTKGMDSGCDKGGSLSAMVISKKGKKLVEEVVLVSC
ncbi:hypothetical protein Cantr_02110 [Candida viswanathii]|uniref:Calcineurin-like phosphoesterase domain-containing protein n=1 Tax=Candida viswanathii TaxID=5486 RepID=A0A367YLE6_9ASCO|nr:hypothetical protein Cantr_02110 [Candida viswanathii]